MFAFLWIAVGFSAASFALHASLCCCSQERKLRKDRKKMEKLQEIKGFFNPSRGSTAVGRGDDLGRGSTAAITKEVVSEKPPEETEGYIRESDIGRAI